MNGKHTSGPWVRHGRAIYTADKRKHWVEGRDARPVYVAQIRARHDSEIGARVDDIKDNPVEESEADANATLIAAAPDMLEALLALTRHVQECHEFWRAEGFPRGTKEHGLAVCLNNRAGELIAAAIDKATGSDGGAR